SDPNYTGAATNTLAITPAPASIAMSSLTQIYDGTAKPVQATSSPSGLAVSLAYHGSPNAPTNAGSYTVVGTINNPNYSGTATNTLAIGQAPATVALSLLGQVYDGSAKPVQAVTVPAGLSLTLTYNGKLTAPTNAGTYTVVALINEPNYSGGSTNTLMIAPAQATISLSSLSQVYDGTAKPVQVSTLPAGLSITLMYDGASDAPTNAGRYTVVGTVNDSNYQASVTNALVIAQAQANISLAGLSPVYNGSARPVQATTIPAGLAVALTYNGQFAAPSNAGSYTVLGKITDPNFQGAVTNTLIILQAQANVALANLVQVFDGTPKAVTVTTTPGGLQTIVTYNGQTQPPSRAGRYTVTALVNQLNYQGGATNTLTIQKSRSRITPLPSSSQLAPVADSASGSLAIRWDPTPNEVVVYRSSDLRTWEVLTTVNGLAGELPIDAGAVHCFFRAQTSSASGNTSLPLTIGCR
ncbi:MAG TPA: MBG domain-containing protein, partial [Verrucomicrobiae bacterium]|nr:MBG domain-containing protein [Verrucomicrobiae bacterium]